MPNQAYARFTRMFPLKSFYSFRFIICFECSVWGRGHICSPACTYPVVSAPLLYSEFLLSFNSLAKRDSFMFWFCPHCHHVSVLVEVPHWLSYCSFVLNFDVGKLSSPILWHFQGFPGHSKPFTFLLLLMQHNSNKFNLQHWVWRDVSAEGCTPFWQRTCVSSQHPH